MIVYGSALQNPALSEFKIFGNDGSDSISISQATTFSTSLVQGGNGDDTINIAANFFYAGGPLVVGSTIRGGADEDTINIFGGLSSSTVNGNKGDDLINVFGLMSNARVFGGSENDTIDLNRVSLRNSRVNGSNGSDTINIRNQTSMVDSTVFGGAGNDFINVAAFGTSTTNAYTVSGDLGNDIITLGRLVPFGDGADGDNVISTGEGNDEIRLRSADGDNTIDADVGADLVEFSILDTNGNNTVIFDRGDSVAATAFSAVGTLDNADTITFGNSVDRITGFSFFADEIDVDFNTTGNIFEILTTTDLNFVLNNNQVYFIEGTLVGDTFTMDDTLGTGSGIYILSGSNQTLGTALISNSNMIYSDAAIFAGNIV